MDTYIKRADLVIGKAYAVDARNFQVAIWDGEQFQGVRYKLGTWFIAGEYHYDDDSLFGTCKPIRVLV